MQLIDYLKSRGEGVRAFAVRIGRHEGTIRKIAYRQRNASVKLALEIERATEGEVDASSLNDAVAIVRALN